MAKTMTKEEIQYRRIQGHSMTIPKKYRRPLYELASAARKSRQ